MIWREIRANRLIAHYPNAKAIILLDDLRAWVEQSTTESPRAVRYMREAARELARQRREEAHARVRGTR